MSILDALKVQKASQQSVSQLAALPQNEIIRLAQLGQIPADVVPVIINEKARMASEMANLRAASQMQQGTMPTVIEQAMQANAQAEAPLQMSAQASPEQGVAALPTGQMFQGQNYQSGGIVAFDEGGDVEPMPRKEAVRPFASSHKDKVSGKDLEVLMAGLGMDSGSLGIDLAKLTDTQKEDLATSLIGQYRMGDATIQGRVTRPEGAPAGVYGMNAGASYPVGAGRMTAGINALRMPEGTDVTGYNVGYGGRVGPGYLSANVNIPRNARPSGQVGYRIPFNDGGVVGFSGEDDSWVQGPTGVRELKADQPAKSGAPSLAQFMREIESAAPFVVTPERTEYMAALKSGAMSPEDIREQKWIRGLQAGLGILSGTSPYGLVNVGQGVQPALAGYAEDIKTQRAAKIADLKARADVAEAQEAERRGNVKTAALLYKEAMENKTKAETASSQLGARYAENYLAMKKAGGDSRPDEEIRDEGYLKFFKEYNYAQGRAQTQAGTAAGAQAVQVYGVNERFANQAQESVDKSLGKLATPESREYRKLQREDPTGARAAEYRQNLIVSRAQELARAAGAAPAQSAPRPGQTTTRPGQGVVDFSALPRSNSQR